MLKSIVKTLFRHAGLEVNRLGAGSQQLPDWMSARSVLSKNEVHNGDDLAAEPFANRHYRPARLAYQRTQYGDDQRLKYIVSFLDVRDQRVLELGPFHGGHSFILEKLGVRETVAVEGRPSNLEQCLKLQAKYGLDRTRFVLHDIEKLYRGEEASSFPEAVPFDLVFCCGLLYHLPEPARALRWFRTQAPALFLGTQYVEPAESRRYRAVNFQFGSYIDKSQSYAGAWYNEGGLSDAPSGLSPQSFWPYEKDLLAMVRDAGYTQISVLGKDLQNSTPHITLLAE